MEIWKSQKGRDKISYNGYSYRQGNKNLRTINWRCDLEKCPGSLSSPRDYHIPGVTVKELRPHNHGPNMCRGKKRKLNENESKTTIISVPSVTCETISDNDILDKISQESDSMVKHSSQNIKNNGPEYETNMSAQEKAQCVTWFIETKSDEQTQRNFRTFIGKKPPSRSTIRELYKMFLETGSVLGTLPFERQKSILKF